MQEAPGGALIFFPSYAMMQRTYEHWDQKGVIKKLEAIKGIY